MTVMSGWNPVPPRRVPVVGQVLDLKPGDVKHLDRPIRIRVSAPRPEISEWYHGNWVWVHAEILDHGDRLINAMPILIRVDAIPDAISGAIPDAIPGNDQPLP